MNFDIVTGIYRIERRPTAFVVYSLTNVAHHRGHLDRARGRHWHHEPAGLMIGNFSGTYVTYALMLIARRDVGRLALDRELLRRMLHFSVPLIPAGLALWALNVADRFQVK